MSPQPPARLLDVFKLDVQGQRLLVRVDMNVPLMEQTGAPVIRDDTRIVACIPGIQRMLSAGASVTLVSHLGRPTPGDYDPALSLAPIARRLGELLGTEVALRADWLDSVTPELGCAALGENLRFLPGETENEDALARRMAAVCDVYVNDAFAVSHRVHASVHGVARYAPIACAGPLLASELERLSRLLETPSRPLIAVVGGAKIDSKLPILRRLAELADQVVVGGGVANALLHAAGYGTGSVELPEASLVTEVRELLSIAAPGRFVLPTDLVCAHCIAPDAPTRVRLPEEVAAEELILDVGPKSTASIRQLLEQAGTIVWCGPMGVFEYPPFAAGTRAVAEAACVSPAYTVAGGGDTLAALAAFGEPARISFCSTGGGAFLAYIAEKPMPALELLAQRAAVSAT